MDEKNERARCDHLNHADDVYDVAWSPCGKWLLTGAIDGSATIWDTCTRRPVKVLRDHAHYIQGVCWDPLGNYLATASWAQTATSELTPPSMRAGHALQAVADPSGEGRNDTGPRSSCALCRVTLPLALSFEAAPGVMMRDPSAEAQSLLKNDACAVSDAKRALLGLALGSSAVFLPFFCGSSCGSVHHRTVVVLRFFFEACHFGGNS